MLVVNGTTVASLHCEYSMSMRTVHIVHLKSPGARIRMCSWIARAPLVNVQAANECSKVYEQIKWVKMLLRVRAFRYKGPCK